MKGIKTMEKIRDIFVKNLKLCRERKKWTLKEAAEKIGISYSYLVALENGKKSPTFDTLDRLIIAYEINSEVLFMENITSENLSELREFKGEVIELLERLEGMEKKAQFIHDMNKLQE